MPMKASSRPRLEVPMYEGNLNVEELMDWINALNKYFDFEEIEDKKKVIYAATRMKGHGAIWWDELVGASKFEGENSKGFSPINIPNYPVDCLV